MTDEPYIEADVTVIVRGAFPQIYVNVRQSEVTGTVHLTEHLDSSTRGVICSPDDAHAIACEMALQWAQARIETAKYLAPPSEVTA